MIKWFMIVNLTKKLILAMFLASAVAACVVIPAQEMSDARQAIRGAQDAGASAQSLSRARQLLAQAELRLQKAAYSDARRLALDARDEARRVQLLAERKD